jgi:hypothetical protein
MIFQVKIQGNFRLIGLSSYKRTAYTKLGGRKVKSAGFLLAVSVSKQPSNCGSYTEEYFRQVQSMASHFEMER